MSKEPSPNPPHPNGGAFSSLPIQASERRLLVCMAGTHPQPALKQCWEHEGPLGPILPVPQLDVVGFGDGDSAGWRGHGPLSCCSEESLVTPTWSGKSCRKCGLLLRGGHWEAGRGGLGGQGSLSTHDSCPGCRLLPSLLPVGPLLGLSCPCPAVSFWFRVDSNLGCTSRPQAAAGRVLGVSPGIAL